MSTRRVTGGACAVAGVVLLAGWGWALIAAAVLLFAAPEPVAAAWSRIRAAAAGGRRQVQTALTRRAVAAATMPTSIVLVALGAGLAFGVGAGLLTAGAVTGGMSLLLGWNT